MPFKNNVFDRTFCFGVLQHTPVIKKTLIELIKKTKKGGSIVVDFYPYKVLDFIKYKIYFKTNYKKNVKKKLYFI